MPISKKEVAFCRSVANLGSWVEDTCETKFPSSGFHQTSKPSTKQVSQPLTKETDRQPQRQLNNKWPPNKHVIHQSNQPLTKETDRQQTSQQVYKKTTSYPPSWQTKTKQRKNPNVTKKPLTSLTSNQPAIHQPRKTYMIRLARAF